VLVAALTRALSRVRGPDRVLPLVAALSRILSTVQQKAPLLRAEAS
jgi:hypothetical protein